MFIKTTRLSLNICRPDFLEAIRLYEINLNNMKCNVFLDSNQGSNEQNLLQKHQKTLLFSLKFGILV